jgi:hypothetical protein
VRPASIGGTCHAHCRVAGAFHAGTPGNTGRTSASVTPRRIDGRPCTYTTSPSIGESTSPVLLPSRSVV